MQNRRSVVAMLGLASATSAVAVENFTPPPEPGENLRSVSGAYQKERFVQALRKLADEIDADRFEVESMSVNALLEANEILDRHSINMTILHRADKV